MTKIRSEAWHKKKLDKHLRKNEFRDRFGKTFRARVRVPDAYDVQFFNLKNQLGFKTNRKIIKWLMNQAALSIRQTLGTPLPPQERSTSQDYKNRNNPKSYQVNQVWALWDQQVDGMPRVYARVTKLLLEDLKIEVALLEPVPSTDDEKRWFGDNNLPMACGTFKEGTSATTTVDIFCFSHLVNIGQGISTGRVFYRIFPQKGEVWAVFKDWNINWTLHDFMTRAQYDMVEVESYLCEEDRISAIFLNRVGETGAVFERPLRSGDVKYQQFSGKQLLRFSHRVPASKVIKLNINGIPRESWELDPAAVPHYLL